MRYRVTLALETTDAELASAVEASLRHWQGEQVHKIAVQVDIGFSRFGTMREILGAPFVERLANAEAYEEQGA